MLQLLSTQTIRFFNISKLFNSDFSFNWLLFLFFLLFDCTWWYFKVICKFDYPATGIAHLVLVSCFISGATLFIWSLFTIFLWSFRRYLLNLLLLLNLFALSICPRRFWHVFKLSLKLFWVYRFLKSFYWL
jgi:hypothetical protein